jgi:hypothetical protein
MPDNNDFHSFDDKMISDTLEAARQLHGDLDLRAVTEVPANAGPVSLHAGCVSVTVRNHRICLNLPLGFGSHCLPIPLHVPNGTAASVCLNICTFLGVPTGVCVRVNAGGHAVAKQCFGFGC